VGSGTPRVGRPIGSIVSPSYGARSSSMAVDACKILIGGCGSCPYTNGGPTNLYEALYQPLDATDINPTYRIARNCVFSVWSDVVGCKGGVR